LARTYRLRCPGCRAEWRGLDADESGLGPGAVRAFSVCRDCGEIAVVTVPLTASELRKYRVDIKKTVQKMYQGFVKARSRLDDRRRTLAHEVRNGAVDLIEALRRVEERLASMQEPDTAHLESRAEEIARAETDAPASAPGVACALCGAEVSVCRETHRGFDVACPRCGERLEVRLRGGE
jgi:DNA-directed RNA polymerase subunit RPC12/RpoP